MDIVYSILTKREREVAKLLFEEGLRVEDIAKRLNIASSTVSTYIKRICRRHGITSGGSYGLLRTSIATRTTSLRDLLCLAKILVSPEKIAEAKFSHKNWTDWVKATQDLSTRIDKALGT